MSGAKTTRTLLEEISDSFRRAKIESPQTEAEILVSGFLHHDRSWLHSHSEEQFDEDACNQLLHLAEERKRGRPMAYLLGYKDFYKFRFKVGLGVLIPRPETELLVELASQRLSQSSDRPLVVADFGCGSGCIGLSVAAEIPDSEVWLIDGSRAAIEHSRANAEGLIVQGVISPDRVRVVESMIEELKDEEKFDLVAANPPYIARDDANVEFSVKEFEPHEALFSDGEGLGAIESWSAKAWKVLKPSGAFMTEFGYGQAARVCEILSKCGFKNISIHKDLAGNERVAVAEKGKGS